MILRNESHKIYLILGIELMVHVNFKKRFSLIYFASRILNGQHHILEVCKPVRSRFEVRFP